MHPKLEATLSNRNIGNFNPLYRTRIVSNFLSIACLPPIFVLIPDQQPATSGDLRIHVPEASGLLGPGSAHRDLQLVLGFNLLLAAHGRGRGWIPEQISTWACFEIHAWNSCNWRIFTYEKQTGVFSGLERSARESRKVP